MIRQPARRRGERIAVKLSLTALILGLLGTVAGIGTFSAFSDTTQNPNNSFQSGTVVLSDDDSGTAMLSLANAKPGDSDAACIVVDYSGTLTSSVRLYGNTGGSGLDQYLDLTVTRGTKSSGFASCADFNADGVDYIGAGNGVVYTGTLQGFPDGYGGGIVDAPGSPDNWTNGEAHAYRFAVSVVDDPNAAGLDATQTFTWEARNV